MALAHELLMFALPWLQGFFLAASISGQEVHASFDEGITVRDAEGYVLARAPGFERSGGSADAIEGVALGDAQIGSSVVALAATTGGHNESVTWLTLYRVDGSALQPIFTGVVERHLGRTTKTGTVTVVPGGVIYQDLKGHSSIWLYDESAGRYVQSKDLDRSSV